MAGPITNNYNQGMASLAEQHSTLQQSAKNIERDSPLTNSEEQRVGRERINRGNANPETEFRYGDTVHRTAWTITTERRRKMRAANPSDDRYAPLVFRVNPASYQFDNPFRQNVAQAKGGPVVHTFRDVHHNYSNLGYPTINIEMSSGSLMPRATVFGKEAAESQHWNMSPNVANFYRWLEIIQEDTVYNASTTGTPDIQPNYQIINMQTLLFPNITLYGYFVQNANWSEQAENPAEVQNWQVQFLIHKTFPTLKGANLQQLYHAYDAERSSESVGGINANYVNPV